MYEYSAGQVALVRGASQEVEHTASRHSGPRRWLRSVEWLIAAGLHPRANATTLVIARDLGARMDYSTGHVRYCLDETVARTGVSKASVKRHVAYLRELGSLAWVQHGTKANVRRALGLGGYAATATVYAAVIPAAYDHAMGHRIIGTGYGARIVMDYRQMPDARPATTVTGPVDNASSGPVDNSSERSCEPPSLTSANEKSQVQMVGGFNYTPHAGRRTASLPNQTRSSNEDPARRTPLQVAREIRETRRVRALVNWTQKESLRRLAYVLRPYFDRGLDSTQIADELTGMCLGWRPKQPATYIRTALIRQAAQNTELAAAENRLANQTWRATPQEAADLASLEALFSRTPRTDDDRRTARAHAKYDLQIVIDHLEDHGDDDAIDLYGTALASRAARLAASASFQSGVVA
ncbi:cell wall protein [Streptomyces sp. NPDC047515]|uniref:cell wall protein n=1 Tax=Streptomyces sp. NPDC047515 TaxID=3155380 RepID=UPI0033F3755F